MAATLYGVALAVTLSDIRIDLQIRVGSAKYLNQIAERVDTGFTVDNLLTFTALKI